MSELEKQLKAYYREIRHYLPGFGKLKKQIMDSIRQSIGAYLEENPAADFEEIQKHFGTPQQIATSYVDEMTTPEILKKFSVKKTILTIICAAVVTIVIIWLAAVGIAIANEHTQADGYYDVGTVIEE